MKERGMHLIPKEGEFAFNFAYGANMSEKSLKWRQMKSVETIGGVLRGYQLAFSLPGMHFVEPSFANLIDNPNQEVHGILHKLDRTSWFRLMRSEGGGGVHPDGYFPEKVSVETYDGLVVEALAIISRPRSPATCHRPPSERYLKLLREGAKSEGLHADYRAHLENVPVYKRHWPGVIFTIITNLPAMILILPALAQRLCGIRLRWTVRPVQYLFQAVKWYNWFLFRLLCVLTLGRCFKWQSNPVVVDMPRSASPPATRQKRRNAASPSKM